MTFHAVLIITDLIITDYPHNSSVEASRAFSVSPIFDTVADCREYMRGRVDMHHNLTVTREDAPGVRARRLIEYDIVIDDNTRMFINWDL